MQPYTDGNKILSPRAGFLAGKGANYTSQFGEDGLIASALAVLGTANRWCFEVGAHDGIFFSNTARLRESGWRTILIEADAEQFEKLRRFKSETVWTIPKKIGPRSLDQILKTCESPADLDFGVIDIDGQDWWAWDGMREHRPRLMLVEFQYASEDQPPFIPECDGLGQANYQAILELGAAKEYEPLAKTNCNILFAAKEIL
jgi:hypothetical protein